MESRGRRGDGLEDTPPDLELDRLLKQREKITWIKQTLEGSFQCL